MRLVAWILWHYYGAVARAVIEDYDSPADAAGLPLLAGSMTAAFVVTATHLYSTTPGVAGLAYGLVGGFLALLTGGVAAVWLGASVVYATQRTEVETPAEVGD